MITTTNRPAFNGSPVAFTKPVPLPAMGLRSEPAVQPQLEVNTYRAGDVIYRPSDPANGLYILRRGRVRLLRGPKGAPRTLVALLKDGDIFGDAFPAEAGQMREFAIADAECEIAWVDSNRLRSVCAADSRASHELLSSLAGRLRRERQRLEGFTARDVAARLAETILTLGETHGERCIHGGQVDLRQITQQDLADLVGATRSFVSTLINSMKREGALGSVGRVLCIHDVSALRKIAELPQE